MELIKHALPDSDELSDTELKYIPDFVQEIWYWYQGGGWDGRGYMILLPGDEYSTESLSHCSCYGPTSDLNIQEFDFKPLNLLSENCSKEYLHDIQPLLDVLKATGYTA